MNYIDSIGDAFKSPKWLPNLLLAAVCILIPIVGPIALMGWHIGALFGRRDHGDFVNYPEFDFGRLGTYIGRGVWPFLVSFVAGLIMVPVVWVVMFAFLASSGALVSGTQGGQHAELQGGLAMAGMIGMFLFITVFVIVFNMLLKPLTIAAAITQDFGAAFNFQFIKTFIARTWIELILSTLFTCIAAMVLMVAGAMVLCIGMYLSVGLITFMQWHLDRQLYDLHLARGGPPLLLSPKLNDAPPPLPVQEHSAQH